MTQHQRWEAAANRAERPEPSLPTAGDAPSWERWVPKVKVIDKWFRLRTPADIQEMNIYRDRAITLDW